MTENPRARGGVKVGTAIAYAADMAIFSSNTESGKESVEGTMPLQPYAYASRDPRALRILAKTIYREMRSAGLSEEDLMSVASEMLSLVAGEIRDRRDAADKLPTARVTTR